MEQQREPGNRSCVLCFLLIFSFTMCGATVASFVFGRPDTFSGGDDWGRKFIARLVPFGGCLLCLLLGCAYGPQYWKSSVPTWVEISLVGLGLIATIVLFTT